MKGWLLEGLEGRVLLAAQVVGEYAYQPAFGKSVGFDVTVQGDGKVVGVGTTYPLPGQIDVLVVRYQSLGAYDRGFGNSGIANVDVTPGDQGLGVALQSDGKIVIAGQGSSRGRNVGLLIRLNTDGTRDASFGRNGVVTASLDSKFTQFRDVAVWGDKIIVAGTAGWGTKSDVLIARFRLDGTFDGSFSGDGIDRRDLGGADVGQGLAVSGDGRAVVGGYTSAGKRASDVAIVRYRADGTLDKRFSKDGIQVMDYAGGADRANAVLVDEAGRILLAGTIGSKGKNYTGMLRITASGKMDSKFGKGGWFGSGLALQRYVCR